MGELSPTALLESLLNRIDSLEPRLRAWVTIDKARAMEEAERLSEEAERGVLRGSLHGIPMGVKDIFYTRGLRTTAGSKILADFVPSYDAAAVARLRETGGIILGKTETTEFASYDPAPTRNPWNLGHTPGGSSSGSAAVVSSGMCPAALGSQTGGSTIRPASFCGIVGFKPTYGRISRFGVFPLSWSLDHVGIFTRTVGDAALMLEALAGRDQRDPTSSSEAVPTYTKSLDSSRPPRMGLLKGLFQERAEESVRQNIEAAMGTLMGRGAEISDAFPPQSLGASPFAQRIIMYSEAASVHEETFRTKMGDYRPKLRGMLAAGLLVPASTYIRAQRIRARFINEVYESLKGLDCLLMPSTTAPAPTGLESTGDPSFNAPWSLSGFPTITIPSGLTDDELPLGIQLVGRPFEEVTLLRAARWCEGELGFGSEPHNPHLELA